MICVEDPLAGGWVLGENGMQVGLLTGVGCVDLTTHGVVDGVLLARAG